MNGKGLTKVKGGETAGEESGESGYLSQCHGME